MRRLFRTQVSLLLLLLAAPAVCAAPEAILHTGPGTTVDNAPATDGMRVFAGQTLNTTHAQSSTLLLGGTSLLVPGDTQLHFNGDSAELISGAVLLTTKSRFRITSGCATVTPRSIESTYFVETHGKLLHVGAQKNDVDVKTLKTKTVKAGKTVAVDCAAPGKDIVTLGGGRGTKIAIAVSSAAAGAVGASVLWNMSASSPTEH